MRVEKTSPGQLQKLLSTEKPNQQKQQMEQTLQPAARKLTGQMSTFQEIIVVSTTSDTWQPNIISQEEDNQAETYTCPTDNTQAKTATRMLNQECTLSTMQIPHLTQQQSNHIPMEMAGQS